MKKIFIVSLLSLTITCCNNSNVKKFFSVTWKNGENVLDIEQYEEGSIPNYKKATPTKPKSDQYTYNFSGWTPEIAPVKEDATYFAKFDTTVNTYKVTWLNWDDKILYYDDVPYGDVPIYGGKEPHKDGTDRIRYDWDENDGWNIKPHKVESDQIYKAKFKSVNKYLVRFLNDDESKTVLKSSYVAEDEKPIEPDTPTKAATAKHTYTFKGWDKPIVKPTCDIDYNAVFDSTINKYTITWLNDDDKVLEKKEWEYDSTPSYSGGIPTITKEGYKTKFIGWDKDITNVVRDMTYKAKYIYLIEKCPKIEISTEDGEPITSKEEYKKIKVKLSNTIKDFCFENVEGKARVRGNSSAQKPKLPYRIKFNEKRAMFTQYKNKDWTLLANYSDRSLSRNMFIYELSKQFLNISFSSINIPVDLYLNNKYLGNYLLCDQIETGKHRVNIDESIAKDGNNGFLIERDGRAPQEGKFNQDYFISNGQEYAIKSPDTTSKEYLDNVEKEVNYINSYFNDCLYSLRTLNWDKANELMDIDSFADCYILDELSANEDSGFASCYFYKDKNGKLFKGPIWDYDRSCGNCNYGMGNSDSCPPDKKLYAIQNAKESNTCLFYKYLYTFSQFKSLIKEKLNKYKKTICNVCDLLNSNDEFSYYSLYKDSFNNNFAIWNVMGKQENPIPKDIYTIKTADAQLNFCFDWVKKRYDFMIKQFSNI